MGLSLKHSRRNKKRRSYADYKPPRPRTNTGRRSDPFRIVLYLGLIACGIWVLDHQEETLAYLNGTIDTLPTRGSKPAETDSTDNQDDSEQVEAASVQDLAAEAHDLYTQGRYEEAIVLYEEAASSDPENPEYPFQVARLNLFNSVLLHGTLREDALAAASQAADRAILADPFSPKGYTILGKVQDWQDEPEKALSTLLRALELDDKYAFAHSCYAEALLDVNRWDQAQESIQLAIELSPDDVDVRRDYAYILESLTDYASAASQYEAALTLEPKLPHLNLALSRSYRVLGRYNEALDILFKLQTDRPKNALLAYEIGRTYETYIGDPNAAMEHFQEAVTIDPEFAIPWMRIGTIWYQQGAYSQAIDAFERVVALDAANVNVVVQLGIAYAYEGDCDTAQQYLIQAQSLANNDELILDAIALGYEVCQSPTPIPVDVLETQEPEEADD